MEQTSQQIIFDMLSAEMDRYWTRFNIFLAVQVGALLGIINSIAILLVNPIIFRFVLLFLVWFSITSILMVLRGHDLQRSFVLALTEIEASLPEDQQLLAKASKYFRLPTFLGNYACTTFAIFCCICWLTGWVWLESTNYQGIDIQRP